MKKALLLYLLFALSSANLLARQKAKTSKENPKAIAQEGITKTDKSKCAVMTSAPLGAVHWTGGFWQERFQVLENTAVESMWETWQSDISHGFNNFLVASGEKKGKRHGPPFHDGDMYKWLEAVASVYAVNKSPELERIMDRFISVVVKCQREDGYLHTPVIAAEREKAGQARQANAQKQAEDQDNTVVGTAVGTAKDGAFGNKLNFETYNLGHLITAGIIHKRATGKLTLFNAAVKAADFLCDFYDRASEELAKNAVCPSHYMAMIEIYRETGNERYLRLAENLINIRGSVKGGTDDNQDREPFREQYCAKGHSVRANYLYSGVADVYLEDGEEQLLHNLESIWQDIVTRKMYITGGCGALYDGTSPDGTDYKPDNVQKVHQSYGRPYQLPHSTAHNETCANIGNMLFSWRMFSATKDAKYMDIVETCLYNSILSGISLDGKRYFYTNPMRMSDELPYTLRWPKERTEYISCFCCPPNTLRTLCQAQDYAYSLAERELLVNLYGASRLDASIPQVGEVSIAQETDYPWSGDVSIGFNRLKGKQQFKLSLRIPEWSKEYKVSVNGADLTSQATMQKGYLTIDRTWKQGDKVSLSLEMRPRLVESNPLVEENRGQVALQRGPVVYCLESTDLGTVDIDNVLMDDDAEFAVKPITIDGSRIMALETEAKVRQEKPWQGTLYRDLETKTTKQTVRLIPYYAWGNRGKSEMTVWIPVEY